MYSKKRIAAFTILLVLLSSTGYGQDFSLQTEKSDSSNLVGKIQDLRLKAYRIKDVKIKGDKIVGYDTLSLIDWREEHFAPNGNLVKKDFYSKNSTLLKTHQYQYNKENKLSEETIFAADKFLGGKSVYHYQRDGNLKQVIQYDFRDSISLYVNYKYDKNNKATEEKRYNKYSICLYHRTCSYDSAGNLILFTNEETPYKKNNDPYRYKQVFNEKNLLLSKQYFNKEDSLLMRWDYSYDSLGKRLSERVTVLDQILSVQYWTYDKEGRLVELYKKDMEKRQTERTVYQYNTNGKYSHLYVYMNEQKKPSFYKDYYYDEKGNWIAFVERGQDRKPLLLSLQEIVYY